MTPFTRILWRCIDAAEPADAKAMILEMYERGLASRREAAAAIRARGLGVLPETP